MSVIDFGIHEKRPRDFGVVVMGLRDEMRESLQQRLAVAGYVVAREKITAMADALMQETSEKHIQKLLEDKIRLGFDGVIRPAFDYTAEERDVPIVDPTQNYLKLRKKRW